MSDFTVSRRPGGRGVAGSVIPALIPPLTTCQSSERGTEMTVDSDRELLARYHAGDECALQTVFERYEAPVFQFLLGVLRNHHQAEDSLQETFVRALEPRRVDPIIGGGCSRSPIARPCWPSAAKSRDKTGPRGNADSFARVADRTDGPVRQAELRDEVQRIRALLQQLPATQRDVILQRVYEGKRFREIADTLRCPVNTALARMHEGLKKLRVLWDDSLEPVNADRRSVACG